MQAERNGTGTGVPLSDFYIQKLDDLHTEKEVRELHDVMVMDYTEKMRKYYRSDTNSKHINACKEYIYSHIKERITMLNWKTDFQFAKVNTCSWKSLQE